MTLQAAAEQLDHPDLDIDLEVRERLMKVRERLTALRDRVGETYGIGPEGGTTESVSRDE